MRTRRLRIALLLATLVVIVVAGFCTQWRLKAVALKVGGQLPTVGWNQIVSLFGSGKSFDSGFVRPLRQDGAEPCPVLWDTPVGPLWGDYHKGMLELLFREQLVGRVYHNRIVAVHPGDVVLDVGGHLGTFTAFALGHGASRVVTVEPVPELVACCERSFADQIARGQVTVVPVAAAREHGTIQFDRATVEATTIDDIVKRAGLDRLDFVKMDIEGYELDALTGARETLARYHPRMAMEIHRPEFFQQVPAVVLAAWPDYRVTATASYLYFSPASSP